MVASYVSWSSDFLVLLMWSAACWCFGVAFAIYRAVSWVDRMRAWAASVSVGVSAGSPLAGCAYPGHPEETGPLLAQLTPAKGEN